MKKIYILSRSLVLGLLISFSLPGFTQVEFGDIENLSESDGTPSDEQNLAQDGSDFYMVWNEWGDLIIRKSDDAGVTWSDKQTIYSALDYGASYPVVAASGDHVYVFYFRNTVGDSQIFMIKSDDGGESFGNEVQISDSENGAQIPQAVAVDDKVYLAFESRDADYNYQIVFKKSEDYGESWTDSQYLTDTESSSGWCNIAYDQGTVFVSYNEQTGEEYDHLDIFFTKSTDEGENWTDNINVSQNQDYNARLSTTVLDNSVYIVSSSKVDGIQSDIRLYRSFDRGDTWESPMLITDNSGENSRPDIWVARNETDDHRIYITYSDGSYTGYDNAYLKYSLNNGSDWSEHFLVSQEIEDGAWPQIIGLEGNMEDELYFGWNRPDEGSFQFEVYGRPAVNPFSETAVINGTVENEEGQPISEALVTVGTYTTNTGINGAFNLEVPGGSYSMTVEADGYETYYEDIEVESGNTYNYDITLQPYQPLLFPPLNPEYSIEGSDLTLTWDPPASDGSEMRYDDGSNSDEVGGEVENFEAAIRFPVDDLAEYEGKYLTEVNFYISDTNCQIFARVWTGGSQNYEGDLVFEQEVENLQNGWNSVEIDQPIYISAEEEIWMGYRVINPEFVYPAGTDDGPAIPYKGDMILYYSDWVSMSEYFDWDINWNIYGLAVSTETPAKKQEPVVMGGKESGNSRIDDFDNYNVYKNDELLATVPSSQTSYTDEGLSTGSFTYEITSVLGDQESNPSESVQVVITSAGQQELSSFSIYPNPARGWLNIKLNGFDGSEPTAVLITDLQGRKIVSKEITGNQMFNEYTIELPGNLNGMYLLHVNIGGRRLTEKIAVY